MLAGFAPSSIPTTPPTSITCLCTSPTSRSRNTGRLAGALSSAFKPVLTFPPFLLCQDYNDRHGGKWSFKNLVLWLEATRGHEETARMVDEVEGIVVNSLKAVQARAAPSSLAARLLALLCASCVEGCP